MPVKLTIVLDDETAAGWKSVIKNAKSVEAELGDVEDALDDVETQAERTERALVGIGESTSFTSLAVGVSAFRDGLDLAKTGVEKLIELNDALADRGNTGAIKLQNAYIGVQDALDDLAASDGGQKIFGLLEKGAKRLSSEIARSQLALKGVNATVDEAGKKVGFTEGVFKKFTSRLDLLTTLAPLASFELAFFSKVGEKAGGKIEKTSKATRELALNLKLLDDTRALQTELKRLTSLETQVGVSKELAAIRKKENELRRITADHDVKALLAVTKQKSITKAREVVLKQINELEQKRQTILLTREQILAKEQQILAKQKEQRRLAFLEYKKNQEEISAALNADLSGVLKRTETFRLKDLKNLKEINRQHEDTTEELKKQRKVMERLKKLNPSRDEIRRQVAKLNELRAKETRLIELQRAAEARLEIEREQRARKELARQKALNDAKLKAEKEYRQKLRDIIEGRGQGIGKQVLGLAGKQDTEQRFLKRRLADERKRAGGDLSREAERNARRRALREFRSGQAFGRKGGPGALQRQQRLDQEIKQATIKSAHATLKNAVKNKVLSQKYLDMLLKLADEDLKVGREIENLNNRAARAEDAVKRVQKSGSRRRKAQRR